LIGDHIPLSLLELALFLHNIEAKTLFLIFGIYLVCIVDSVFGIKLLEVDPTICDFNVLENLLTRAHNGAIVV
jgi:hypothetical protein